MNLRTRKAKISDLDFLISLEEKSFLPFQRNSQKNIKHSIKSTFQSVIVIQTEEEISTDVGAMILFNHKRSLRIYSVAVLPQYQNKGVGDFLLNHVTEIAGKKQIKKITLEANVNNHKLIAWYEKRGFQQIGLLKDYYCKGEDAVKMEKKLDAVVVSKKTSNIIVINQPYKWKYPDINARIVTVKDYINSPQYHNSTDYRVFNLCSSYKYQSYGYYVSLLAQARGQRAVPSITTIRDLRILNVIHSAAYDFDDVISKTLSKNTSDSFSLNIYFGHSPHKKHKILATKLFQFFEAPLFRVNFIRHDKWLIKDIKILTFDKVPSDDLEFMYESAAKYFNRKRFNTSKLTNYKYDLAILVNPQEANPPSDSEALQKFKTVANKKGVYVEFITKSDVDKINEFDALFIRETTNVNDHTYEISKMAYAEGLIVIDDPWSILKCSNKIYQNETFKKHKLLTPHTVVFTKNMFDKKTLNNMNYPIVLKQPDSSFSLGVMKVDNKVEALAAIKSLFKKSDMIICQEFLYTDYDWRIGILDNKPLFACKYYMSQNHWQIYNWKSEEIDKSGDSDTLKIEDVPEVILKTARKASALIGDGLYGVDLKLADGKVYVIEVNENPNIDFGIEDFVLRDFLYEQIIDSIITRIEIAKNIRKINFTNN